MNSEMAMDYIKYIFNFKKKGSRFISAVGWLLLKQINETVCRSISLMTTKLYFCYKIQESNNNWSQTDSYNQNNECFNQRENVLSSC